MKIRNRLLTLALVLAVLGLAGYVTARVLLPRFLTTWVAGPQFERMLAMRSATHSRSMENSAPSP